MSFNRRHLAVAGAGALCTVAFGISASQAATASGDAAVAQAVESYRTGLLKNNAAQLDALCMDQMTYGHSSGRVQTKAEVLADAPKGTWKSITFDNVSNRIVGDAAYSRFVFTGENVTDGKPNTLKFGVVMVWHKQGSHWKLLVRQGYKI